MTLRTEIEALLVEFDHFAYDGAPLDVAVEKLQEILARTAPRVLGIDAAPAAPRVLNTLTELDSEEAFETLCIVPSGGLPMAPASRSDGVNFWHKPGWSTEYSSAELFASFTETGVRPAFTAVDPDSTPMSRRVLTTLEDLNSPEAFYALCIVPYGGPFRVAMRRNDGANYWREPGYESEYSSAELLAHFASIGALPAFTLINGEP